MYCIILCCSVLCCVVLYSLVLSFIVLSCIVLYCVVLCYYVLLYNLVIWIWISFSNYLNMFLSVFRWCQSETSASIWKHGIFCQVRKTWENERNEEKNRRMERMDEQKNNLNRSTYPRDESIDFIIFFFFVQLFKISYPSFYLSLPFLPPSLYLVLLLMMTFLSRLSYSTSLILSQVMALG